MIAEQSSHMTSYVMCVYVRVYVCGQDEREEQMTTTGFLVCVCLCLQ